MSSESKKDETIKESSELGEIAETEYQYLHQRLRDELGREPTEEELDEWLRQHTEGY